MVASGDLIAIPAGDGDFALFDPSLSTRQASNHPGPEPMARGAERSVHGCLRKPPFGSGPPNFLASPAPTSSVGHHARVLRDRQARPFQVPLLLTQRSVCGGGR